MSKEQLIELRVHIEDIEHKQDWGIVGREEALELLDKIIKEIEQ